MKMLFFENQEKLLIENYENHNQKANTFSFNYCSIEIVEYVFTTCANIAS